jgi:catechol 2,3-dioxygenase-like lactoylglutathione lyase family enzyme
MAINGLDHINVTASAESIEACRVFYAEVLGLTEGARPAFRSRGYWMYAGGRPVVHLTVQDGRQTGGATALDHFAFACDDYDGTVAHLRAKGIPFDVSNGPQVQVFLRDPAGVGIELGFGAPSVYLPG